jgi:hypothetical protein
MNNVDAPGEALSTLAGVLYGLSFSLAPFCMHTISIILIKFILHRVLLAEGGGILARYLAKLLNIFICTPRDCSLANSTN